MSKNTKKVSATIEWCTFCENEVEISAEGVTPCPVYGRLLTPCSICDGCKTPCLYSEFLERNLY